MTTTVVVRRIASTPARTAAETWLKLLDLVASPGSPGRAELEGVGGVVMSLIAAEAMRVTPITVHGVGPRLRVYCLYDDDAIAGDEALEDPLAWSPTDGDWHMAVPCPSEDVEWVQVALKTKSTRVTTLAESDETPEAAKSAASEDLQIDRAAFDRP